jgi:hypothetical protein
MGTFHKPEGGLAVREITSLWRQPEKAPGAKFYDIANPKRWSCELCEPCLWVTLNSCAILEFEPPKMSQQ